MASSNAAIASSGLSRVSRNTPALLIRSASLSPEQADSSRINVANINPITEDTFTPTVCPLFTVEIWMSTSSVHSDWLKADPKNDAAVAREMGR